MSEICSCQKMATSSLQLFKPMMPLIGSTILWSNILATLQFIVHRIL